MDIENPLLKDADKYLDSLNILKRVKGENILDGKKAKDIREMRFHEVQFIKETLQNPTENDMFKIITMVFGFKDFNNLRLYEFYKAYNFITEEIKSIYKQEELLVSQPSERLINAGIEKMSVFGALNIIDDIARRFGQPPMDVENWSYNWIFSLSLKMKYESDIQKNLENAK